MAQFVATPVETTRQGLHLDAPQETLFEELYCEHFELVARCLRQLGVPEATVEDALQEVYVVALRHFDAYQPGTRSKAWLRAIACRVASTHRRTLRRRREAALVDTERLRSHDAGPLQSVMHHHARAVLHEFLDSLSESQRSVFIRAELEQMTAPEVAAALDMKLNTVYSRLRVARRKFECLVRARHAAECDGR